MWALRDTPEPETAEVEVAFECPDAAAAFEPVWNEDRRGALKAAFEQYGPMEGAAFAKVSRALDARQSAWAWAHDAACAARTAQEQDAATYAKREACLEHARRVTDTFVALLSEGTRYIVDGALSSVTMLPRIELCADLEALDALESPTESQREGVEALEREILLARALMLGGKHHETVAMATGIETRARDVGHAGTLAAVLEILARVEMQTGALQKAEEHAHEAANLAAKAGDPEVEVRSFGTLVYVVGAYLGRPSEALGMLTTGRDVLARSKDPRAQAYFKSAEATVLVGMGELDEANTAATDAIALLETVDPAPPEELAMVYSNRSNLARRLGDEAGAMKDQHAALRVAEDGLGKKHALYGSISMALGQTHYASGDYEEAIQWFRASLEAWETSIGRDHASCALALTQIGNSQMLLERYDDAAGTLDDALQRLDASGEDDPNTRLALQWNSCSSKERGSRS